MRRTFSFATTSAVAMVLALFYLLTPASGVAFASEQRLSATSPSMVEQKSAEEILAIKDRVAEWLKTCMSDWDQATHMTKNEWRTTCQRVAAERGKFMLESPTMEPVAKGGAKTRQR
jgi:hypothetical protein